MAITETDKMMVKLFNSIPIFTVKALYEGSTSVTGQLVHRGRAFNTSLNEIAKGSLCMAILVYPVFSYLLVADYNKDRSDLSIRFTIGDDPRFDYKHRNETREFNISKANGTLSPLSGVELTPEEIEEILFDFYLTKL